MRKFLAILVLLDASACSTTNIYYVTPTDAAAESGADAAADVADAGRDVGADVTDAGKDSAAPGCYQPKVGEECAFNGIGEDASACSTVPGTYWHCELSHWAFVNCQGSCPACSCLDGGFGQ